MSRDFALIEKGNSSDFRERQEVLRLGPRPLSSVLLHIKNPYFHVREIHECAISRIVLAPTSPQSSLRVSSRNRRRSLRFLFLTCAIRSLCWEAGCMRLNAHTSSEPAFPCRSQKAIAREKGLVVSRPASGNQYIFAAACGMLIEQCSSQHDLFKFWVAVSR